MVNLKDFERGPKRDFNLLQRRIFHLDDMGKYGNKKASSDAQFPLQNKIFCKDLVKNYIVLYLTKLPNLTKPIQVEVIFSTAGETSGGSGLLQGE